MHSDVDHGTKRYHCTLNECRIINHIQDGHGAEHNILAKNTYYNLNGGVFTCWQQFQFYFNGYR